MRSSIAMATYNAGRFLAPQLASIANQSRLPDELVVFDDASGDDTPARLRAFAQDAPFPVRVELCRQKLGATGNFERAFAACSHEVILLADQDDLWRHHKVERMLRLFEDDADLGAAFSDAEVIDGQGHELGYRLWDALRFDRSEQQRVSAGAAVEVFVRHVVAAGTTLALRREFRELCLPFPALHSAHDAWLALLVAAVAPVRILDEALVEYRVHGDNLIGIRQLGLRDQFRQARAQLERNASGYAVDFFEQTQARLRVRLPSGSHRVLRPGITELLDQKISHERARIAMNAALRVRARLVAREAVTGRYRRYSYGWRSLLQDLLLRRNQGSKGSS